MTPILTYLRIILSYLSESTLEKLLLGTSDGVIEVLNGLIEAIDRNYFARQWHKLFGEFIVDAVILR